VTCRLLQNPSLRAAMRQPSLLSLRGNPRRNGQFGPFVAGNMPTRHTRILLSDNESPAGLKSPGSPDPPTSREDRSCPQRTLHRGFGARCGRSIVPAWGARWCGLMERADAGNGDVRGLYPIRIARIAYTLVRVELDVIGRHSPGAPARARPTRRRGPGSRLAASPGGTARSPTTARRAVSLRHRESDRPRPPRHRSRSHPRRARARRP